MQITGSTSAPRVIADPQRIGAADSVRAAGSPAVPGHAVDPPSPSQNAILARSLVELAAEAPSPADVPADTGRRGEVPRVLKPWGIEMLPADKPEPPGGVVAERVATRD